MITALIFAVTASAASGTFSNFSREAADALLPVEQENALGEKLAAQVEAKSKLVADPEVQAYVASVGAKIARAASRSAPKGIKLTYKVIDDPKTVNAFALPGGHIYVYSGLLKMADDEAELASVLGHETAHVVRRHTAQRIVAQYGIDEVLGLALGRNPSLVEKIGAQLVEGGTLLRFTHDEEAEADAFGLPFAVAAGYDPNGMVRFFARLKKQDGNTPMVMSFLSDHPLPAERIAAARQRIARMRNPPHATNAAAYDAMKARLH